MTTQMNSVLSRIFETGVVQRPDGREVKLQSNVSREEGLFLQQLIAETKAKASLEIGLAYGISALFICDALAVVPGARHTVVDLAQFDLNVWGGAGIDDLKLAGYGDLVGLHDKPSHLILPKLESEGRKVDFAFVDGAHTFDFVLVDFFSVDRILNVGGIVAFDDCWMPSVKKALRYILSNRSYRLSGTFRSDRRGAARRP